MKKKLNKNFTSNSESVLSKTLLGFYIKYAMKNYWKIMIFWAILFVIIYSVEGVMFPLFQRWFIALFEQPVPVGMTFVQFALPTIITIVSVWLVVDILEIIRSVSAGRWRPKLQNQISEILNNYVHSQSIAFWTKRMAGKINSQISYICGGFLSIDKILMIFVAMFVILLNIGLVLQINSNVAILLGAVFLFRLVYSILLMKPMNKASKKASGTSSSLSGKLIDSISNYSIVKMFAAAKIEKQHLDKPRKESIKDRTFAIYMQRLFWGVPMFVWDISFGLTMLMCAMFFVSGEMKVSEIVFTISVYFSVMGAISRIVNNIPDLVDVIGSAQQSYKELIQPLDITDVENAQPLDVKKGLIEFENVSFKYGRKKVIDNLSLKIKSGEKIGLVGSSGAGKTTLVNLIMRFYDPSKGSIYIDSQNIHDVKQDSLRRNIAFIPQEPAMFNRSLGDNIRYGKFNASMKEIRGAAKKAQADKFIMGTDKKYGSIVGDRGVKLSGGQRQRVAIARAFLKDSPLLILDEATSALDSETENYIQESFETLSKGRTTIVIAHRLSTLRNMDRIVVMDKGSIIEQGTHHQLLRKKNGLYKKLWDMQSGGFIKS